MCPSIGPQLTPCRTETVPRTTLAPGWDPRATTALSGYRQGKEVHIKTGDTSSLRIKKKPHIRNHYHLLEPIEIRRTANGEYTALSRGPLGEKGWRNSAPRSESTHKYAKFAFYSIYCTPVGF